MLKVIIEMMLGMMNNNRYKKTIKTIIGII